MKPTDILTSATAGSGVSPEGINAPLLEKLSERETNVRREVIASITTFLTMAYSIFVNPNILASVGMDKGAVFMATCLAAAIGCLVIGLYANYPIALAPGMGKALIADSSASVVGSMLGSSTITCYVESTAGTSAGERTGLTAVVCASLFLLAIFFFPLIGRCLPTRPQAPCCMLGS